MLNSATDHNWMTLAFALANKGRFSTSPNPAVGCVIVKNNELVATGFHRKAGESHAEILALKSAGNLAKNSTAYITLEPCFHTGKTPPCVQAIIASGISRVVIASIDPNPSTSGKSIDLLRENNIEVTTDILSSKNLELNRGFFNKHQKNIPWVCSKIAQSIDGNIALKNGQSKWITSEDSRRDVQIVRAAACCILTGIGTVLADNPKLTLRDKSAIEIASASGYCRQPIVAIMDSNLRTPSDFAIIKQKPYIFYSNQNTVKNKIQLELAGANCIFIQPINNQPSIKLVLEYLANNLQVNNLLVEAGAKLNTAFLKQKYVDEILYYLAPSILGDGNRAFTETLQKLTDRIDLSVDKIVKTGNDICIKARIKPCN